MQVLGNPFGCPLVAVAVEKQCRHRDYGEGGSQIGLGELFRHRPDGRPPGVGHHFEQVILTDGSTSPAKNPGRYVAGTFAHSAGGSSISASARALR